MGTGTGFSGCSRLTGRATGLLAERVGVLAADRSRGWFRLGFWAWSSLVFSPTVFLLFARLIIHVLYSRFIHVKLLIIQSHII
jgi:hypothetical protein